MPRIRLTPADRAAALAGGGGWLGAGVVLVSAGILAGLLMTGLLPLPFIHHDRIGLAPVPARQHSPPQNPVPVPVPVALPSHAGPPPVPPHPRPLAFPSPHHIRPGCQRGECKRPPATLPAPGPLLPSLPVPVPSLSRVPTASPLPVPSLRVTAPALP